MAAYLKAGHGLDEFLDDFPTVSRYQAVAVLDHMRDTLLTGLYENTAR